MMGRVTISTKVGEDSTSVSNIFIDEYMQDANDAQIKIYLYLLRMMKANLPTSVSALADKFNHTEKDVVRALKYWEKKGLISLEYDNSDTLIGIHMEDITSQKPVASRKSEPIMRTVPASKPESTIKAKPNYTAAELSAFKQSSAANIVFPAEQYFKRPLTSTELMTLFYIKDELKFSDDLLDYLMQYCVDNHKADFRYVEKVAINWTQQGIKTPKQARVENFKHDHEIIEIMKARKIVPRKKKETSLNRGVGSWVFQWISLWKPATVLLWRHRRIVSNIVTQFFETGMPTMFLQGRILPDLMLTSLKISAKRDRRLPWHPLIPKSAPTNHIFAQAESRTALISSSKIHIILLSLRSSFWTTDAHI